jgi:hypothetical protein
VTRADTHDPDLSVGTTGFKAIASLDFTCINLKRSSFNIDRHYLAMIPRSHAPAWECKWEAPASSVERRQEPPEDASSRSLGASKQQFARRNKKDIVEPSPEPVLVGAV